MQELARGFLHRLHDARMRVAGRADRDVGGEVEEPVAVDVTLLTVADRLSARGKGPIASPEKVAAHLRLARELFAPGLDWQAMLDAIRLELLRATASGETVEAPVPNQNHEGHLHEAYGWGV